MTKRASPSQASPLAPGRSRETTVAGSIVLDMVAHLERQGIAGAALVAELGASFDALTPDDRVPGSYVEQLWALAERLTGDANLGLHMAEALSPGALDIVGYVLLSSATARDLLERLARYASLLNDGLRVKVDVEPALTTCAFEAVEGRSNYLLRSPRQPIEGMAAGVVVSLQRFTRRPIVPVEVTFRHAAPRSVDDHRRLFGASVAFGRPADAVRFRTDDLATRVTSSHPALLEAFEQRADAALARLGPYGPVGRQVAGLLRERLRGEAPSLASVGAALAMSTRSVQRSLRDEGSSYQRLLDEVRRELALQHLDRPGTTASEVAFLLGFSEPAAFSRAFRRWTGASPRAIR